MGIDPHIAGLEARQVPDEFQENVRFARQIHTSFIGVPDNSIQYYFRENVLQKVATNG